jgi:hypothetical protein
MINRPMIGVPAALLVALAIWTTGASASPAKTYECQKPVRTGVEVYGLHNIAPARACPPALALYAWENSSEAHAKALYGCHRPKPSTAGYPYLKLHDFHGWKLSLVGRPYGLFTMSRGSSSFHVGGTDFPLNCT